MHTHRTIGVQRLALVLAPVRLESLVKVPSKTRCVALTDREEGGIAGSVPMTQGAAELPAGFFVPAAQPRSEAGVAGIDVRAKHKPVNLTVACAVAGHRVDDVRRAEGNHARHGTEECQQ